MTTNTGHTISGAGGAHYSFNMFGARCPLLAPIGEGGAGGGAGGGTGGAGGDGGAGSGAGGEGGAAALSDAAKKEVEGIVNAAVNGSITQHLTRFRKTFTEEINTTLGNSLSPLGEQIKALAESVKRPDPGQGGAGQQQPQIPVEIQNALKRSEERIRELETQNKAEREARESEKATRLREEERTLLANSLRAAGLPDTAIRSAVALLHTEDKRVARNEEGNVVFRIPKGTGAAAYVDELPVEGGVAEWLKTDEGKSFLPARPAQGAGGQPARPGQAPRNKNEAKEQATATLANMLLQG